MHDETIQALVVLGRDIDDIAEHDNSGYGDRKHVLVNVRKTVNTIMDGIRSLSQNLRPPALDRLGLIPALEWLASYVQQRSGIPVSLKVQGQERKLSEDAQILLFRITQEALRNVWLHSKATAASVTVIFNDIDIRIIIEDNGIGIDLILMGDDLTRIGKLGLAGIRERVHLLNGNISINSQQDHGTKIRIEVPL